MATGHKIDLNNSAHSEIEKAIKHSEQHGGLHHTPSSNMDTHGSTTAGEDYCRLNTGSEKRTPQDEHEPKPSEKGYGSGY